MTNFDERLLDAHLLPIRDDIREIKAMLMAATERGNTMREDMAAMKVEIGFLKRVVFGGGAAVGLLVAETVIARVL